MDSFKITKGSEKSNKSSLSSIPLAIRFNAEEESIEEFIKPRTEQISTSSQNSNSPQEQQQRHQQQNDDFSWKSFQENLFHRNKSGSIENISSSSPSGSHSNVLNTSSDTNTIGTWKLIKGKVSQAMEDIKSSKNVSTSPAVSNKIETSSTNNEDSDQEIMSNISDKPSPSTFDSNQQLSSLLTTTPSIVPQIKLGLSAGPADSDSDIDIESNDDGSSSLSFRKSIANLRSKSYMKSKVRSSKHKNSQQPQQQQQQQQQQNPPKKIQSPNLLFSSSFPSTKAESFLKRRKFDIKRNNSNSSENVAKKKDHEIESGIEVVEDMMILSSSSLNKNTNELDNDNNKLNNDDNNCDNSSILGISFSDEMITFKHRPRNDNITFDDFKQQDKNDLETALLATATDHHHQHLPSSPSTATAAFITKKQPQQEISIIDKFYLLWGNFEKKFSLCATLVLLISILILPLPNFFCGVFTCLFTISLFQCIIDFSKILLSNKTNSNVINLRLQLNLLDEYSQFGGKFKLADNIQVCEIQPAEEHLCLKSYSGWMNEINNYDPANHHLSMTTPVLVKLHGASLSLSNTSSRVPRRAMWNEVPIDKDSLIFTRHRYFNLLGCHVEMCPKGLARKRHFSRKYPIQLIIKNTQSTSLLGGDKTQSKLSSILDFERQQNEQTNQSINSEIQDAMNTNLNSYDIVEIKKQSLNESNEDISDKSNSTATTKRHGSDSFDFGNVISNSDLQKLQSNLESVSKEGVPCGDETRLLLFAKCDREKEDWYRRFKAASKGLIYDQQEHVPDIVMFTDDEIANAIKATTALNESEENSPIQDEKSIVNKSRATSSNSTATETSTVEETRRKSSSSQDINTYEGVIITTCALRNTSDYIKFMSKYQKACFQSSRFKCSPASTITTTTTITNYTTTKVLQPSNTEHNVKRNRKQKSKEDELWKGIDQTLFKQQSGNVIWCNILVGRVLHNCFNNKELLDRIQEFLQRKLSAIRLPSFMEDVVIDQLDLGDTPPLIHRVSQPLLDERGIWIDADISYEGLMQMTITTKLNLLRLKRSQNQEFQDSSSTILNSGSGATLVGNNGGLNDDGLMNNSPPKQSLLTNSHKSSAASPIYNGAIYDSDAESTGASSSDSESVAVGGTFDAANESHSSFTTPSGGSSRRFLRIVDRITASNLFQSATEISYIQRAMENMSTKITLKVELKGLVSRIVVNLPPPPSDRVWLAFRGPPRLWISAKPTVGDHAFDWSIVTTIIENKLCDEVYKYLVYPNMVDIIIPILGQPTYKETN